MMCTITARRHLLCPPRNTQFGKRPCCSHNTIPGHTRVQVGKAGGQQDAPWFSLHYTQSSADMRAQTSPIYQHTIKFDSGKATERPFRDKQIAFPFPLLSREVGSKTKTVLVPTMTVPFFLQGFASWSGCLSTLTIMPTATGTLSMAATTAIVSS